MDDPQFPVVAVRHSDGVFIEGFETGGRRFCASRAHIMQLRVKCRGCCVIVLEGGDRIVTPRHSYESVYALLDACPDKVGETNRED